MKHIMWFIGLICSSTTFGMALGRDEFLIGALIFTGWFAILTYNYIKNKEGINNAEESNENKNHQNTG